MDDEMAEEMKYESTEEEALEKEKREQEWQESWGKNADLYIREIDNLLAEKTREGRMQVKAMFADQDFFWHYRQVDMFAIMFVIMGIYELEEERELSVTILDQADTVAGLVDLMFQFRMILYRLGFGIGQDTEAELISFIREHNVSPCWMNVMMTTSVVRPLPVALSLERMFEGAGFLDLWFSMLVFLEEYFEGNYRVNAKIAGVYRGMGRQEMAEDYQRRIPQIPAQLYGQEELVFELQELLWKVKYKQVDAEGEIALFIKDRKDAGGVWEFLVERLEVADKEYYLKIANALLDAQEVDEAEVILRRSLQTAPGDELILCLLAELSMRAGKAEEAMAYLSQIEKPGELAVKLHKTCITLRERK